MRSVTTANPPLRQEHVLLANTAMYGPQSGYINIRLKRSHYCPFHLRRPTILVMESTEVLACDDFSVALNRSMYRWVFG
jgi:hypothetical protein